MRGISMVVSSLALLLAGPSLAHPGHGLDGGSSHLFHYLSDPLHLAPVAAAALAFALWRRTARSRG